MYAPFGGGGGGGKMATLIFQCLNSWATYTYPIPLPCAPTACLTSYSTMTYVEFPAPCVLNSCLIPGRQVRMVHLIPSLPSSDCECPTGNSYHWLLIGHSDVQPGELHSAYCDAFY